MLACDVQSGGCADSIRSDDGLHSDSIPGTIACAFRRGVSVDTLDRVGAVRGTEWDYELWLERQRGEPDGEQAAKGAAIGFRQWGCSRNRDAATRGTGSGSGARRVERAGGWQLRVRRTVRDIRIGCCWVGQRGWSIRIGCEDNWVGR
jgi:hypothetical protein